ncbi:hypothetical protein F2Q68_00012882 [Brassica cretica]|uniref:Uncharacterized protein n=1 Tax=Brassica cretica TaxID=69181 RepID=A0A8S9HJS3_BRACR|nr:hypothetical protein F2Q68_00012882 [Brassica cretica]
MWTRTWTEASLVAPVSWSESLKSVCYYSRFKTLRAPRHLLLWGFPSSFHRVFCRRSRDPASLTNSASAAKDPSKLQVTPDVPEASIYLSAFIIDNLPNSFLSFGFSFSIEGWFSKSLKIKLGRQAYNP